MAAHLFCILNTSIDSRYHAQAQLAYKRSFTVRHDTGLILATHIKCSSRLLESQNFQILWNGEEAMISE